MTLRKTKHFPQKRGSAVYAQSRGGLIACEKAWGLNPRVVFSNFGWHSAFLISSISSYFPNLLIVDDDETIQRLLTIAAQDLGWRSLTTGSGIGAIDLIDENTEAVILDDGLPSMNGLQTLIRLREKFPNVAVIILTGHNDAETAVKALRAWADDYLTKSFDLKRLFDWLKKAKMARRVILDPKPQQVSLPVKASAGEMKSSSPQVRQLLGQMRKAALLDSTIMLTGESGTGKTYFAREHSAARKCAGTGNRVRRNPLLDEVDFTRLLTGRSDRQPSNAGGQTLQEIEREAFVSTYLRTGKNKARTAGELGISERSVYNLLGRHGVK